MENKKSNLGSTLNTLSLPFARFSIFVVYFWFGILKIFSKSPANPLVAELLEKTMPFISFETFIVLLGLFEIAIGILFLFSRFDNISLVALTVHLFTTVLPLVLLPLVAWQSAFVPTIEGQYIIKNILIVAVALSIAAHDHPVKA